jgi:hypothetical protein
MEIFSALSAPSSSKEIYTTKYGSFISAYAPIDDSLSGSAGNTHAVLGIDIAAHDYTSYMSGKGYAIIFTGLISIILAVGAIACFGSKAAKAEEACGKDQQK